MVRPTNKNKFLAHIGKLSSTKRKLQPENKENNGHLAKKVCSVNDYPSTATGQPPPPRPVPLGERQVRRRTASLRGRKRSMETDDPLMSNITGNINDSTPPPRDKGTPHVVSTANVISSGGNINTSTPPRDKLTPQLVSSAQNRKELVHGKSMPLAVENSIDDPHEDIIIKKDTFIKMVSLIPCKKTVCKGDGKLSCEINHRSVLSFAFRIYCKACNYTLIKDIPDTHK